MNEIVFRVWHWPEKKMYYRGYQKVSHILLCKDDGGKEDGRGIPVMRAAFDDCEMLEATTVKDCRDREIFEGDILRVLAGGKVFRGIAGPVPDMFRSRGLHPLHALLQSLGLEAGEEDISFEILGNRFEHPQLLEDLTRSKRA